MPVLKFLQRLPPAAEFAIVLLIAFGSFIHASLWWVGGEQASGDGFEYRFTDADVVALLVEEAIAAALIAAFLWVRGWRLADFPFGVTWLSTAGGIALLWVFYLVYGVAWAAFGPLLGGPAMFDQVSFESSVGLPATLALSVFNPLYEEVLVVGYIVRFVAPRHGGAFAIGVSALVRLLYHLYQGPIAILSILPLGILFAAVYWRWRMLWPLVVAHGIIDYVALAQ